MVSRPTVITATLSRRRSSLGLVDVVVVVEFVVTISLAKIKFRMILHRFMPRKYKTLSAGVKEA